MFGGVTLDAFIDAVAERFVDRLAERFAERDDSLIDQRDPRGLLGRRHIEAVRRRRAEGAGGAYIKGRDFLLTPQAAREELGRLSSGECPAPTPRSPRGKLKPGQRSAEQSRRERLKRELESEMRSARRRLDDDGDGD